jgi:hypothetical protein
LRAIIVNPKKNSLRLTKIQGAIRQTDAAIGAFARGDFDVAITLAGAAEGMIGRKGPHLFRFMQDSPTVEHVSRKNSISTLNLERDWLKHTSGARVLRLEREHAAIMITRAASKLARWSPKVREFKDWLLKNMDDL